MQHTLEPLVYKGPAEGWPKEQWRLKSPKEILSLRICDMTMGSGAFLVQACRYLSERLVEAWEIAEKSQPGTFLFTPEGEVSIGAGTERLLPRDPAERLAIARRYVADRCLFGVDINPMAVEMAKLSLWLVTLQRDRPFTFLDHALKCGDSLLGISRLKQLETFSLSDAQARQVLILSNYDELIRVAIAKHREIESLPSNEVIQIAAKEVLFLESEEYLSRLKLASDLLIAATITEGTQQQKELARVDAHLKVVEHFNKPLSEFHRIASQRLNGRRTFHWPLEFPEVFARGGFDALVGNPPFIGGKKITSALGTDYRDHLVTYLANRKSGVADLCAYFFLRAYSLLWADGGMFGLLATNTIAQGDTREVGLEQIVSAGGIITRAVPSQPWPGEAALEIVQVWVRRGLWHADCVLANQSVSRITPYLSQHTSMLSKPKRIASNADLSHIGSIVLGMGFVLTPAEAQALLVRDSRNGAVLFRYLVGEDFNSNFDQSPSRWVINFRDWPLNLGQAPEGYEGPVAADYQDCIKIVEAKVKPERSKNKRKFYREKWWQFGEKQMALYRAIAGLKRAIAVANISRTVGFAFVPVDLVYAHKLTIFASDSAGFFAMLQSSHHYFWAWEFSSTMKADLNYSPTDCFETFPLPESFTALESIGERYHEFRSQIMQTRQEGLTKTYHRFHNPEEVSADIIQLRRLHVEMDQAVAAAYGWTDIDLGHGFRKTKQGTRYTLSEPARRRVLDRLLALNHQRYDEEVKAGLHDEKGKTAGTSGIRARKPKKPSLNPVPTLPE